MGDETDTLSLDHLGLVLEAIYTANLKWYNLGLRLGLHVSTLDAIKTRCLQNPEECLREMLREWLKQGSSLSTWEELVNALTSPAVGEGALGVMLKAKHCRKFQESADGHDFTNGRASTSGKFSEGLSSGRTHNPADKTSLTTTKLDDQQSSPDAFDNALVYSASFSDQQSSDDSKEQKNQRAFGCGCGRCSFTTFLDQGCPEPVKSLSSFPYLQTQGLNHGEVMILKGRLYNEFQLITRHFSKFNFSICMSLIHQEIPVKMLARVLRDLRAFQPSESDSPLLRDRFDEIKEAKDIDEVFDILAEYVSFFSFHITEHIVENLGTKEDKKLLVEYKEEREEYCKRNIFECPSYSTPKPGVADLVMKVEGIERYNLKHLAELISHMSKVFSVSQHTLQLCSVEKGCVQLNIQIPHFVKEHIFPLAVDQEQAFVRRGIVLVKCERWIYKLSAAAQHIGEGKQQSLQQTPQGSYSHGAISRKESEQRLMVVGYDCFLLRESESLPGRLTLSVKQKGELKHVLIECTEAGFVPKGEVEPFQNMPSFVNHISSYLPLCPKPSITDATTNDQDSLLKQHEYAQPHVFSSTVSSDCMSDTSECGTADYSGDNVSDWTGGTGDSGVVLWDRFLPPVPPKPRYEKLLMGNKDKEHQYSKVGQRRYVSMKISRNLASVPPPSSETLPPPMPLKRTSSLQQQKGENNYETLPSVK